MSSTVSHVSRFVPYAALMMAMTFGVAAGSSSAQAREGSLSPGVQLSVDACMRGQGTTPEVRIASCSLAMESASLPGLDRAEAHLSRGEAYLATGNQQNALADYRESQRLRALHAGGV